MTTQRVIVPWKEGLHLRAATRLVKLAGSFHSTIRVHYEGQVANLRSIVSVVGLCAMMGSALMIEAVGDDEQEALRALLEVFEEAEKAV